MNYTYESHLLIEDFGKVHKCHCNILDQDCKFLDNMRREIGKYAIVIKIRKGSCNESRE